MSAKVQVLMRSCGMETDIIDIKGKLSQYFYPTALCHPVILISIFSVINNNKTAVVQSSETGDILAPLNLLY
jgi:hypothetical protein